MSDVVITDIKPAMANTNGRSKRYRQFTIQAEFDYVNPQGMTVPKQNLSYFCTAWEPETLKQGEMSVVDALDTFKVGDRCSLTAFEDPQWRLYVANASPNGIRAPIPDADKPPYAVTDPSGNVVLTVEPNERPWELDQGTPGIYVHSRAQLNVITISAATDVEAGKDDTDFAGNEDVFTAMQKKQQGLDQATASEQTTSTSQNGQQAASVPEDDVPL